MNVQVRKVSELLTLKEAGVLAPDSDNDWCDEESSNIKAVYRVARFRDGDEKLCERIRSSFPMECDEVESEMEDSPEEWQEVLKNPNYPGEL